MLVWIHLFPGLKGAPLVWSGFAAAIARVVQGTLKPTEGRMQLVRDDPTGTLFARGRRLIFVIAGVTRLILAINEIRTECEHLMHTKVGGLLQAERLAG